jgi:rRNA maturation RNase YbeY
MTEIWPATASLRPVLEKGAATALETADRPVSGEIEVSFVAEDVIRELNRRYLNQSGSTDVIAFDLGDGAELIGDVYIAPEVAARNAEELGIPEAEELIRLVIHGVLHLLGHDHPEGETRLASPMFRLQEELVQRLTGAVP